MARPASSLANRGVTLAELALLTLIAFVLAKTLIALIWPQTLWKPVAATPGITGKPSGGAAALPLNAAFDPFYTDTPEAPVQIAEGEDAPETSLDLKLFGRRADDGGAGSAILQTPDGAQKTYRVGDEIISGVTLRSVTKDFIVLEARGQLERLTFVKPESGLSRAPLAQEAARVEAQTETENFAGRGRPGNLTTAQIMASIRLDPATTAFGESGFRITPRGGSKVIAGTGLRSGDIITAVNGRSLGDPSALPATLAQLSKANSADLTVFRNSTPITVTIGR